MRALSLTARSAALSAQSSVRRRGAAMLEAVMVAGVLAVLLVGVAFVSDFARVRGVAREQAVYCALSHAQRACDEVPAECKASPPSSRTREVEGAPDLVAHARASTDTGDFDPFSEVPVLGAAFAALFGQTTRSIVERSVHDPFRQADVIVREQAAFLCNEQPRSAGDVAMGLFSALWSD